MWTSELATGSYPNARRDRRFAPTSHSFPCGAHREVDAWQVDLSMTYFWKQLAKIASYIFYIDVVIRRPHAHVSRTWLFCIVLILISGIAEDEKYFRVEVLSGLMLFNAFL